MLLTKALKQAHTFIGSAQLVGQVSHKSIETNRLFIKKHFLKLLWYHIASADFECFGTYPTR